MKQGKVPVAENSSVSAVTWPLYFEAINYRTIGSAKRKEDFYMITLFVIGIIVFTLKLVLFAFKAAWGITKAVLFVIGIPALLIVLFAAGMVSFAFPLLVFALLAAFIWPVLKGN